MTVSVDVLGVVTMSDLTRRVEAAYAQQLHGPLRKWFTGFVRTFTPTFGLGGGPSPGSASLRIAEAARLGLEERLAVPQRIYEKWGDRVHVVFDEFQDVLRVDGEPAAVIRSVIQHHVDAASYVFVGSELGMMEQIFDRSPAWPFQTAPVLLHQLESEDLGDYVRIRFERTGKEVAADALGAYLRVVEGHPQRAMLVAHHWWGATRRVGGVTELDTAIVTVTNQANGELTQLWSGLTAVDSRCVVAIATGVSPYSARIGPGEAPSRSRWRGSRTRASSHGGAPTSGISSTRSSPNGSWLAPRLASELTMGRHQHPGHTGPGESVTAPTKPMPGGGARIRTGVRGFAGPCLNHSATPPADR